MRVLVAGMGNVLREDDGFGVRVAERLLEEGVPPAVTVREVGTGGIHLVQELMEGYDVFVLVDTVDRGGEPGDVSLLEPRVPETEELSEEDRASVLADTHYTVPAKVLVVAKALDALPARTYILGCQPRSVELGLEMGDEVTGAVDRAVARLRRVFVEIGVSEPEGRAAAGGAA